MPGCATKHPRRSVETGIYGRAMRSNADVTDFASSYAGIGANVVSRQRNTWRIVSLTSQDGIDGIMKLRRGKGR